MDWTKILVGTVIGMLAASIVNAAIVKWDMHDMMRHARSLNPGAEIPPPLQMGFWKLAWRMTVSPRSLRDIKSRYYHWKKPRHWEVYQLGGQPGERDVGET